MLRRELDPMNVNDKVAVVTGGGAGIGAALAQELVVRNAQVVVADLNGDAADAVAKQGGGDSGGRIVGVGADVSDSSQIRCLIDLAERKFGPVDLYFANAGIAGAPGLDVSEEDWDRSLEVNLRAHIRAAKLL